MSEFQESAQFLAGPDLPKQVLSGLFNKSELPSSYVGLINLTPYDTWVEQTCLRWEANNDIKIRSLSVSKNITTIEYCQRVLAIKLLEDCARLCWVLMGGHGWTTSCDILRYYPNWTIQ